MKAERMPVLVARNYTVTASDGRTLIDAQSQPLYIERDGVRYDAQTIQAKEVALEGKRFSDVPLTRSEETDAEIVEFARSAYVHHLKAHVTIDAVRPAVTVRGRNDAIKQAEAKAGIKYPYHFVWVDGAEDASGVVEFPWDGYSQVYAVKGDYDNPEIVLLQEVKAGGRIPPKPYYTVEDGVTRVYLDGFSGAGTEQSPFEVAEEEPTFDWEGVVNFKLREYEPPTDGVVDVDLLPLAVRFEVFAQTNRRVSIASAITTQTQRLTRESSVATAQAERQLQEQSSISIQTCRRISNVSITSAQIVRELQEVFVSVSQTTRRLRKINIFATQTVRRIHKRFMTTVQLFRGLRKISSVNGQAQRKLLEPFENTGRTQRRIREESSTRTQTRRKTRQASMASVQMVRRLQASSFLISQTLRQLRQASAIAIQTTRRTRKYSTAVIQVLRKTLAVSGIDVQTHRKIRQSSERPMQGIRRTQEESAQSTQIVRRLTKPSVADVQTQRHTQALFQTEAQTYRRLLSVFTITGQTKRKLRKWAKQAYQTLRYALGKPWHETLEYTVYICPTIQDRISTCLQIETDMRIAETIERKVKIQ